MPQVVEKEGTVSNVNKSSILEVIFEVRWQLTPIPNTPALRDPGYPLVYGRLYDRVKERFPIVEDLPTTQMQPEANPYVVRHRLRKVKEGWPLMQIGPGILTVNEGAEFDWKAFKEDASNGYEGVRQFFPSAQVPLKFLKVELRYIHGHKFEGSATEFMAKSLSTQVKFDPALFPADKVGEKQEGLLLNVGYQLKKPIGQGMLSFSLGQVEGQQAIVQQSLIQVAGEDTPQDLVELGRWLDNAQALANHWQKTLIKS